MPTSPEAVLPGQLHVITYDIHGVTEEARTPLVTHQSGLVVHTHHLLDGLVALSPDIEIAVTRTGAGGDGNQFVVVPGGKRVFLRNLHNHFTELEDPVSHRLSQDLVRKYYEDTIDEPQNPVYESLAEQYARLIYDAGIPDILLQNPNPIVGVLKAEELGTLPAVGRGLHLTGVIHDVEGYERRLRYIAERLERTEMAVHIIAISNFVGDHLIELGVPETAITTVSNGMDIAAFDADAALARSDGTFAAVKRRNDLPLDEGMILVNARRVSHKGHLDVIAAGDLRAAAEQATEYVAFTGFDMTDSKSAPLEAAMHAAIAAQTGNAEVILLDELTDHETAACTAAARLSILASTEPEGFGYANLEAMLAGVPVVTSRLGGPLDYIVDGDTGLLVEPHDPAGLARAIDRVLSDPILYERLRRGGRKAAEHYTLDAMVKGYASVLKR